jgi:glucosamine--fructose-6-phosphate aminotransferase (isomerizing)
MLSAAVEADHRRAFSDLAALPDALARAVEMRPDAARLAERLEPTQLGSVIGRGFAFPPALEIALKLKETSYTAAEPFSAADFTHGPVALVEQGFSALVIDVGGRSSAAADEASAAIRARGGQPAMIRAGQVAGPNRDAMSLNVPVTEPLAPIVALVLGQLVAVELALTRGVDPARPRGLRKVTSTR